MMCAVVSTKNIDFTKLYLRHSVLTSFQSMHTARPICITGYVVIINGRRSLVLNEFEAVGAI